MTQGQDEISNAQTAADNAAPKEVAAPALPPANAELIGQIQQVQNMQQTPPAQDQISKLISHPAVKGYLGKSIKIVACFAILGCLLLLAAVNALSSMISGALPH